MVNVDEAVVARLKKEGKVFEILVDCDKALELKTGKTIPLEDVIATNGIFKDVKKGEKASEHDVQTIFNTTDAKEVAAKIIKEGEVQLTKKHKEKARETIRKQIVQIIHRNAVDAQTGLPHPAQRIESAMQEAKVNVREYESAEEQVERIIKELRPIIPIKFETMEITVTVPAKFAGQSMNVLKKYRMVKNEWLADGNLLAVVKIPAGIQEEFFNDINKTTHGEAESRIERQER